MTLPTVQTSAPLLQLLSTTPAPTEKPLPLQMLLTTSGRLLLNTFHRLPYALLPEFSRALGVPLANLQFWVGIRSILSLLAPFLRWIPQSVGRRATLVWCLLILAISTGWFGLMTAMFTFVAVMMIEVLVKIVYDPQVMTHIAERTPYHRRGLMLSINELAWSGAMLLGIPLATWLIAITGNWLAPFWMLLILLVLVAMGLAYVLPSQHVGKHLEAPPSANAWSILFRNRNALLGLAVGLLISFANEALNLTYAGWLKSEFNLPLVQLGMSGLVIGLAELLGEGGVAGLSDRIGKRRAVIVGCVSSAVAYTLLPRMSGNVMGAQVGLFLAYLTFEFALVASIPLISEIEPSARDLMIAVYAAILYVGRVLSIPLANQLPNLGMLGIVIVAAVCNVLAVVCLSFIPKQGITPSA